MSEAASEKLYYRIGEIADILEVNTSVLRFWETQFDILSPRKTRSGQRLYSQNDLELIREIYRMLYVEKLTISGAKTKLAQWKRKPRSNTEATDILYEIKLELIELRKLLV